MNNYRDGGPVSESGAETKTLCSKIRVNSVKPAIHRKLHVLMVHQQCYGKAVLLSASHRESSARLEHLCPLPSLTEVGVIDVDEREVPLAKASPERSSL